LGQRSFPVLMLLFSSALSFVGFAVVRYRSRILVGISLRYTRDRSLIAQATYERILIVGGGEAGRYASWLLDGAPGLHVIGYVDDDLYKQGARIAGQPVLGRSRDLSKLVSERDIGIVVFAIHKIRARERRELLQVCAESGAQVLLFPDFLSVLDTTIKMNGKAAKSITSSFVLSWPGVAPAQVERWLLNIDQILQEQGPAAAQEQIEMLRGQLQHAHEREELVGGESSLC
jgi:FlaA1/EpsC-like NDP-sugar epimerase